MQHPSSVEMGTAGTVIGVLIALGFVIFVSALVAAYVLWKDGCCKKRREEERSGDAEENHRPRVVARHNSSLFKYLTRFTDSGHHRNNLIDPPPAASKPSYGGTEGDNSEDKPRDHRRELTTEYNRMPSPVPAPALPAPAAATYEVPGERPGAYENVQPNIGGGGGGRTKLTIGDLAYDYVTSPPSNVIGAVDEPHYEFSDHSTRTADGPTAAAANSQSGLSHAPHYETNESFLASNSTALTPPSQHYAVSYATPGITQSRNFMEASSVSAAPGEAIYCEPAKDETSLYTQFKHFKIRLIPRNSIRITGFLGSGQFGKVQKGQWTSGKLTKDVAIKSLKEDSDEGSKIKFLQEVAIMGQFSHPNVVKLHGLVSSEKPLMLVIELLLKGDLRNHLISLQKEAQANADSELPTTLLGYCRDIAKGMNYLSRKAFVHRDLAARNILVSEQGVCKVADFGMSRDLEDAGYYVSQGGQIPVKWTAPDALHYKKYSTASDVWSFGCVMYEIWSLGHKPFEGYTNVQAVRMIDSGVRLAPPPGCPREIYSIMISCWHPQTIDRPTFQKLCELLQVSESSRLLKWSVRERAVDTPNALRLGAQLKLGAELHKDLQNVYKTS